MEDQVDQYVKSVLEQFEQETEKLKAQIEELKKDVAIRKKLYYEIIEKQNQKTKNEREKEP